MNIKKSFQYTLYFIFLTVCTADAYYVFIAFPQITTSVLRKISHYWKPNSWFPAALTLTGVLFVMCLYAVAWCLFKE